MEKMSYIKKTKISEFSTIEIPTILIDNKMQISLIV